MAAWGAPHPLQQAASQAPGAGPAFVPPQARALIEGAQRAGAAQLPGGAPVHTNQIRGNPRFGMKYALSHDGAGREIHTYADGTTIKVEPSSGVAAPVPGQQFGVTSRRPL